MSNIGFLIADVMSLVTSNGIKPGFHYTANATTTTQKQSDYKVEQSSFALIALFGLEIGCCRGRNWLNGNQALTCFIEVRMIVNEHFSALSLLLGFFQSSSASAGLASIV